MAVTYAYETNDFSVGAGVLGSTAQPLTPGRQQLTTSSVKGARLNLEHDYGRYRILKRRHPLPEGPSALKFKCGITLTHH